MRDLLFSCSCISTLALAQPVLAANLISNGDFELGNTQFDSEYVYSPAANSAGSQYTIRTNPFPWNPFFIEASDHTSGTGNMFVGNGSAIDEQVWFSSEIEVTPNTDYFFEAWTMNVCCNPSFGQGNPTEPVSPAILSFYANGLLLGTRSTNSLGVWEGLSTTWNSGTSTEVKLELHNSNLALVGNDFAIDDIFLGTETSIPVPDPIPVPEPSTIFGLIVSLGTMLKLRRLTMK